jgi:hypothetical protein
MILRRTLATLSLVSLTACSAKVPATADNAAAGSAPVGGGSTSPLPPIHYDQTAVLTVDGEAQEEKSYRSLLDGCRKSGISTHALTSDEVGKIGRVHVEAWIGPDKQSRHEEQWHLNSPGPCQFALTHVDQTEIGDASGHTTLIDGVTHKVDVQEQGKQEPAMALPESDGELTEGARQAGWTKQGSASDSGAQCAIWEDSYGSQLCVWTGGRQWGYSADGSTALKDGVSRGDSIVFWSHPGRGVAWKLETREFSLGKALDRRAFDVPANLARGTPP